MSEYPPEVEAFHRAMRRPAAVREVAMRRPRVRLTVRCLLALVVLIGLALGYLFGRRPIASVEAISPDSLPVTSGGQATPESRPIASGEGPTHYTLSGLIRGKSYRHAWAIVNRGTEPLVIAKAGAS
jgi:hypothetical protein